MHSSMSRRITLVIAATFAVTAMAFAAAADAAVSKYPPAAASRGFSGSATGWTASSSSDGLCLPPLLCATVANSFQETGGADGGGYIRSAYTGVAGASAVGGTTRGVWESPGFTYAGAAGGEATAINLSLDRRASVDQLLAVAGNSAEYTVRLIDLSEEGEALTLIAPTTLAGANSWTNVSRGSIDPESLTPGDEYRIQITSSYTTGTSVLVTGNADYDNVVLSASDGSGRGGKKGNGKGRGNGGGNGGGAFDSQRLEELLRQSTPGTAVLSSKGKKLFVRVKCPRKIGHACRTTAQGLLSKKRPATLKRTVRLHSGKSKLLVLRVKPKVRKQVAKRKRLLVRQKVRAGKATATILKSRRLIRR
ncbi:MAG TPA: hypothetical protein VNS60_11780 [Solirubrobacterales bacterium]|nr:hypothetical protein [Solirubrobacterales bacterium]